MMALFCISHEVPVLSGFLIRFLFLLLGLIPWSLPAADLAMPDDIPATVQPVSEPPLTDDELLRARRAFDQHDQTTLESIAARAQDQLSDYPRYWALEERLIRGNAYLVPEMQAFFNDYPNSPLTPLLRAHWLSQLGQNQNWKTFEAQFHPVDAHQPALQCYHWQALFADAQTDFFDAAVAYWRSDASWPDSCDPVFRQLVAAHRLRADDLWRALRHALSRNQLRKARYINSFFPPFQGLNEDDLNLATGRPRQFLDDASPTDTHSTRAQRELMLYATLRLAAHDPQAAATWWTDASAHLGPEDQAWGWQQIALQGALNLNPQSLEWFQQVTPQPTDAEWLIWKTRVALRQQDWATVLDTLAHLPVTLAQKPVWQYWKARALEGEYRSAEALALLERVSQSPSYYGLLALEERGQELRLSPPPAQPDPEIQKETRTLLERPLRLYRLGLLPEAQREWNQIEPALTPLQHLAAAQQAFQLGWYDRSIHSADRTDLPKDITLLFPYPYQSQIQASASQYHLSEAWILAVIRQESRFFSVARSRTGAQGLMQLMPATARWAARRSGLKNYHAEEVDQPDTNILLGTYYLNHLAQLLGNPILATMGYNAGPLRAQIWVSAGIGDPRAFLENIPFDETRDYVQQVLYNQIVYEQRLHTVPSHRLHALLDELGAVR
ncbi:MAG: lytic transglycosylase domain-containing protein [Ferrovum myxofaciens]|uniref:lytic transglycosylase domain-containing protein n=1 Tax=Ferrovum myxofaciens TaxID=416213 RepID=UPI003EBA5B1B|nr:MAG: lytic transglycosylase domain-containing protein [Ferrovum myxofaciens]